MLGELLAGFAVALGVAVGGVFLIVVVEAAIAWSNPTRRAHIRERGFRESIHQMLS